MPLISLGTPTPPMQNLGMLIRLLPQTHAPLTHSQTSLISARASLKAQGRTTGQLWTRPLQMPIMPAHTVIVPICVTGDMTQNMNMDVNSQVCPRL